MTQRSNTMTRIRIATKKRLVRLAKSGRRSQVETLDLAIETLEREAKKGGAGQPVGQPELTSAA